MSLEDQNTDRKSLRSIIGRTADWDTIGAIWSKSEQIRSIRPPKRYKSSRKAIVTHGSRYVFFWTQLRRMIQSEPIDRAKATMALTGINSEDRLVQQTFADHLREAHGWESGFAHNAETFGPHLMMCVKSL